MDSKEKKPVKRVRPTVAQVKELTARIAEVEANYEHLNGKYQIALANNVRLMAECEKYKKKIEKIVNRGFFARLFNLK